MPAPDIASLLENFPPQNSQSRAALLDFARNTPLHYGDWKFFKKLFKLAEAPALAGEESDVELLAVLLARIDAAPIPASHQAQLRLLSDTPKSTKSKTVREGKFNYIVGGRDSGYDSTGWRLEIAPVQNAAGLRGALEAVKSVLTPQTAAAKRVYDFNAQNFIGDDRKISIQNHWLQIETENWDKETKNFRVNVADPDFVFLENSGPRAATWQYMKRRARRLLRKCSKDRPAFYCEILRAMLRETFAIAKAKPLDPATQWASMDALFARSRRWKQTPAARGPYQLVAPGLHLKTREECAPEIWDDNLDWTREIFLDEKIPIEANAVALKALRANGREIPDLSVSQLRRFLDGNEPILQSFATRVLASSENLQNQPPEILAAALLLSGAPARGKLELVLQAALREGSTPSAWRKAFAARLGREIGGKSARRARVAARLLAASFSDHVSDKVVFAHLGFFLEQSGENNDWIFARIAVRGQSGDLKFLDAIAVLPEQFRERALQEFSQSARNSTPQAKEAIALIIKEDANQNRIGWRFLEATVMEAEQIRELWKSLAQRWRSDEVDEAAWSEPAAVALWLRADWPSGEGAKLLNQSEWCWLQIIGHFSFEFFDAFSKEIPPTQVARRIFLMLARLQPDVAQRVVSAHLDLARDYAPKSFDIAAAFTDFIDTTAAWQFLESSAVTPETLREVWDELWGRGAQAAAFGDVAEGVLRRAEISAADIETWLPTAPVHIFSPRFFLLIISLAAPAQKVELLLRPSNEQWQNLRSEILTLLQNDANLRAGFWNAVWQCLENDLDLPARFDEELTANFTSLPIAAFSALLPSATQAHEALAMTWLHAHAAELLEDENLEPLIISATHAVDAIRLWGLRRVRERGLSVAVALRLMESGLPQPFALGREYLESAPRESAQEKNYALALCDSPNREVQNYGREFLLRRADSLLDAATLQNLAEHPDTQMQSWVADHLCRTPGVQTTEFDTTILRARGKARRAKESVKQRIGKGAPSTPSVPTNALLELARGNAARDREWALQQLAKRALSGEEIDGLTLEK